MSQWEDPTRGYEPDDGARDDTGHGWHGEAGPAVSPAPAPPPGLRAPGRSMAPPPNVVPSSQPMTPPPAGHRRIGPNGVPELWPGPIPLRPLSFGEIIEAAFSVLRFNPRTIFGLSLLLLLGSFAITGLVAGLGAIIGVAGLTAVDDGADTVFQSLTSGVLDLVNWGSSLIFAALGGILIVPIADASLGRRPTIGESWRRVKGRILPLLGYLVLDGLIHVVIIVPAVAAIVAALLSQDGVTIGVTIVLTLLVALVAVVYVNVSLALASVIVVLEGVGPIAAMRRSFGLIHGGWWRTLAIKIVVFFLTMTVQACLMVPVMVIAGLLGFAGLGSVLSGGEDPALGVGAILGLVAGFLVFILGATLIGVLVRPYSSAVDSMIYLDRRFRTEALAVDLLAEAERVPER